MTGDDVLSTSRGTWRRFEGASSVSRPSRAVASAGRRRGAASLSRRRVSRSPRVPDRPRPRDRRAALPTIQPHGSRAPDRGEGPRDHRAVLGREGAHDGDGRVRLGLQRAPLRPRRRRAVGFVAFVAALGAPARRAGATSRGSTGSPSPWSRVFGTMAADVTHVKFGVPYAVSTAVFARRPRGRVRGVAARRAHAVHPQRRHAAPRAVLLGDGPRDVRARDRRRRPRRRSRCTSATSAPACCSLGLICVPALAWRCFGLNAVVAFWTAYVLTRPLGASFADWLGKPVSVGGLGLGDGVVGGVLLRAHRRGRRRTSPSRRSTCAARPRRCRRPCGLGARAAGARARGRAGRGRGTVSRPGSRRSRRTRTHRSGPGRLELVQQRHRHRRPVVRLDVEHRAARAAQRRARALRRVAR